MQDNIMQTVLDGIKSVETRIGDDVKNQVKALDDKLESALNELVQKGATYSSGHGGMGEVKTSAADEVWAQLEAKRDTLRESGNLRIEIKADVTTTQLPNITDAGMPGVAVYPYGFQHAVSNTAAQGLDIAHYFRYRPADDAGEAAVVAEGNAKPYVSPVYNEISQKAVTIAGLVKVSQQALSSRANLQTVLQSLLFKQLNKAHDKYLVKGDTGWTGFEALAKAHVSTYVKLVDAIADGTDAMLRKGCTPTAVVINPADWTSIVTAVDKNERYLSGDYLQAFPPMTLRGLPVVLSEQVSAGHAYLVDGATAEWRMSDALTVQIGYTGDDWSKNMCTMRGEFRGAPLLYVDYGVMYVTPKAPTK